MWKKICRGNFCKILCWDQNLQYQTLLLNTKNIKRTQRSPKHSAFLIFHTEHVTFRLIMSINGDDSQRVFALWSYAVSCADGRRNDARPSPDVFSRAIPHSESLDRDEIDILISPALPVLMIICCDWSGRKLDAWRDVILTMCFTAVLKMELWFNRPRSAMHPDKQESDQTSCCFKR